MTLFRCQSLIYSFVFPGRAFVAPNQDSTRSKKSATDKLAPIMSFETAEVNESTSFRLAAHIELTLLGLEAQFKKFMQISLKNYQDKLLTTISYEETIRISLKTKNSDLYYRNFYMKYYYFCRQYENYFKSTNYKSKK